MDDLDLTPKEKAAWQWFQGMPLSKYLNSHFLATALEKTLAARRKAEAELHLPPPSHAGSCIPGITSCDGACMDRAHFAQTDWRAEARKELQA